jgi:hypothetical protein
MLPCVAPAAASKAAEIVLLKRAAARFPLVMLLAFVVSIVADGARPETADTLIAMAVLVTLEIWPLARTVN